MVEFPKENEGPEAESNPAGSQPAVLSEVISGSLELRKENEGPEAEYNPAGSQPAALSEVISGSV